MTHGVGFLSQCDKIVVIVEGKVTETGTYAELVENDGAFAEFLRNYSNMDNEEEERPGGWSFFFGLQYLYQYCTLIGMFLFLHR